MLISARKIKANQINAKKGKGPKSQAGKLRSRKNALRHGLSVVSHHNPVYFDQIAQIAKAICGENLSPALFAQAAIIAESEMLLRCIAAERVGLIERMRDPYAVPITKRNADIPMVKFRMEQRDRAYDEYSQLNAKLIGQGVETFPSMVTRKCDQGEPVYKYQPPDFRDEYGAMEGALPNIERLRRYERRAWSRRKKAISLFMAIKQANG